MLLLLTVASSSFIRRGNNSHGQFLQNHSVNGEFHHVRTSELFVQL